MSHFAASRPLLSLLLAFLLVFEPIFTFAKSQNNLPQHQPQFSGQAFEGVGYFPKPTEDREWGEYLQELLNAAEPSNLEKVAADGTDLPALMASYRDFFADSMQKIDQQIALLGEEHFAKEYLDTNKVAFDHPKLGRMEFTSIDGAPLAKIVHEPSGVSFLIYDEELVDRTSEHFKQYLARQHYDAGMSRSQNKYLDENGKKRKVRGGRDVILMSIQDLGDTQPIAAAHVEVLPRKRGLRHWWRATYKHPTQKDVVLGIGSGIAQFATVGAIAQTLTWILPGYTNEGAPLMMAAFSLAYGSMFGIWNSFYHNWRNRGSNFQRDIKNMSVSLGYYMGVYMIGQYGMQLLTAHDFSVDPSQMVASIQGVLNTVGDLSVTKIADSSMSALDALTHNPIAMATAAAAANLPTVHFITNFFTNNQGKFQQYAGPRVFEIERSDLGKVTFSIPKGISRDEETGKRKLETWKIPTPIPQRFWNRQIKFYLPLNSVKFLDQAWFGATLAPALAGALPMWLPFASVLGFGGYVIASNRGINWWAYKYHKPAAEKLKLKNDIRWYYADTWMDLFNRATTTVKTKLKTCSDFLLGL